jgi:hypothetical protein
MRGFKSSASMYDGSIFNVITGRLPEYREHGGRKFCPGPLTGDPTRKGRHA